MLLIKAVVDTRIIVLITSLGKYYLGTDSVR
jgi:hypothetical protein